MDPLHFVSNATVAVVAGKGGVGKTTVTAVLATAAIRRGWRVLVVELDGKPTLDALLPGVEVLHLSASAALAEYLDEHGLARVTRRLVSSGVIDVVATASPGIDDIVVLGKVKQLERSGEHDLILVDGPAAGHALTMLTSVGGLRRSVRGGPVAHQAEEVAERVADPTRCQVVLVTIPETTPVNELAETAFAIEDLVGVHLSPIVVNGVDDGPSLDLSAAAEGSPAHAAAEFTTARRTLHRQACDELARRLPLPQVRLPHLPGAVLTADDIARLADGWDAP